MTSVEEPMAEGSSTGRSTNPFEGLRPPVCSQEDEIRKGIFGQALRLLYTASDEERLRWRHTIEESMAAKRPASRRESQDATEAPGVKRPREDGEREEAKESPESAAASPTNAEFIAAYLRTLLDKVVGLSLLAISAEALRVLCVMLDVPLPKSRSKSALYNTLASFHYTHCEKLGKRVSTSHNLETQLKRDEAMMMKIIKTRPPAQQSQASLPPKPTRAAETPLGAAASRPMLDNVDENVGPASKRPTGRLRRSAGDAATVPLTTRAGNDEESEEAQLEVQYAPKVFVAVAPPQPTLPASPEDDEWTLSRLEKKVASVVQLYDPVTSAVVVKKLAQMGYRSPRATETVEAILRDFHNRQLVFYDSGIAYLL